MHATLRVGPLVDAGVARQREHHRNDKTTDAQAHFGLPPVFATLAPRSATRQAPDPGRGRLQDDRET
jgi:hypothetical protein